MFVTLLILWNAASAAALSELNLDCVNDFDKRMSCRFDAQNCTEYDLKLVSNDGYGTEHCPPEQCASRVCCCSVEMTLIGGETHTASVWKAGQAAVSKNVSVRESVKPNAPTIMSVQESNGNFQVKWSANTAKQSLCDSLTFTVTYHKKGDIKEVSKSIKLTKVDGLNFYEILGEHLEPSTSYLVSVKSMCTWSNRFSDSSEEFEFRTPASHKTMQLAVIVSLSIAAAVLSSAIFGCFIKSKKKWWDSVGKFHNSKLLDIHPREQELLKPLTPIISSVFVEPFDPEDGKQWSKGLPKDGSNESLQQSSGISTGSSSISYANTEPAHIIAGVQDALGKTFSNFGCVSPLATGLPTESKKDDSLLSTCPNPCGLSEFKNKTYAILVTGAAPHITMDCLMGQAHTGMVCDSSYQPSEGHASNRPDEPASACPAAAQQDLILPPQVSSDMPTDMSYQQLNVDSGRFSCTNNSGLPPISIDSTVSGDLASRVEAGFKRCDPDCSPEEAIVSDKRPCGHRTPASSHSYPLVDGDYQAFQTLVEQPDVLLLEQRSDEQQEHLDQFVENSSTKIPQGLSFLPNFINIKGSEFPSKLQGPLFSLVSADESMSVITDSGYQSL